MMVDLGVTAPAVNKGDSHLRFRTLGAHQRRRPGGGRPSISLGTVMRLVALAGMQGVE